MPATAWLRYVPAVREPHPSAAFIAPAPPARHVATPGRQPLEVAVPPLPAVQLTRVAASRPRRRP